MINIFTSFSVPDILFRRGLISHADLEHAIFFMPKIKPKFFLELNQVWSNDAAKKWYPKKDSNVFGSIPFDAMRKAIDEGRVVYTGSVIDLEHISRILVEKFNLPPMVFHVRDTAYNHEWHVEEVIKKTGYPCRVITRAGV